MWSWVPLERPQVIQPLGSFQAFYGNLRFTTAFTRALNLYLSWTRPIQSTPPSPISKTSILMLCIHLRLDLPSGLFPSGFPTNKYTDPLLRRKSGSAGNQTWNFWICSQELWPLHHRGDWCVLIRGLIGPFFKGLVTGPCTLKWFWWTLYLSFVGFVAMGHFTLSKMVHLQRTAETSAADETMPGQWIGGGECWVFPTLTWFKPPRVYFLRAPDRYGIP
jgi:hypothetical protein